ncbi:hypothetical protein ASE08_26440 [Rhizobacter sp. Root16D2]|nr:hypothetical protein ASC88_13145 [Rhizobacter sp. Root29]KQW03485.1 hypothetical protein ASC98_27335 [Rhizobacter sp. Root1238]KRB15909.1 hypothetical protein ASE08_26440 [Rhizobacter sp. Root16D2]
MPPINPLLVKNGLQAFTRIGQQAGKLATAAPGLAEKATGAARLAAKQMSGLSGLAERLPSKLPSAATLQSGIAGLRPRLQNASMLGKMGRLGQAAQMGGMGPAGPMGHMANLGQLPLGQFGQIRDAAQSALHKPMAAALKGSDRASRVAGEFLQALHDIESNALYQNFAPPLVTQMLGEARTGLQAIHDMMQRFQSGLAGLSGGPKPSAEKPSAQKPPTQKPTTEKPTPQQPAAAQPSAPLGIAAKPEPVSLSTSTPAEGVQSLRERGVDLKALQQDMRNYKLHAQPTHDELLGKYKDSADLSIVDDGPTLAKFMLALNSAVRADAA